MGKGAKSRSKSCKSHGALLAHVWSCEQPGIPALGPLSPSEREQVGMLRVCGLPMLLI